MGRGPRRGELMAYLRGPAEKVTTVNQKFSIALMTLTNSVNLSGFVI